MGLMCKKGLVTVFIPSFQHAGYVRQAIESVLNQTYTNLELLISDDGSTDGSQEVIQAYAGDPRVKIWLLSPNTAGEHNNSILREIRGEYFAVLNSDDYWAPDKIEKQMAYIMKHPEVGVVLSEAQMVNEQGTYVKEKLFESCNRTRAEWLRWFFTHPNCLCHTSMLIRSDLYKELGGYRLALSQLPDFEFWIRVLKHTDIYILPDKLVYFRWTSNMTNSSSPTYRNQRKYRNEHFLVLSTYFDNMDDQLFINAFSEDFIFSQACTPAEIACEKAFLYLEEDGPERNLYRCIGMSRLFYLMEDPITRACLEERYGFSRRDFWNLMGDYDIDSGYIGKDETRHRIYHYARAVGRRTARFIAQSTPKETENSHVINVYIKTVK